MDHLEDGLPDFFGEVGRLRVVLQRLDELVEGRHQQVEPPQVGLQVCPVFPQGQLELLAEVDPLEDEVGQGFNR